MLKFRNIVAMVAILMMAAVKGNAEESIVRMGEVVSIEKFRELYDNDLVKYDERLRLFRVSPEVEVASDSTDSDGWPGRAPKVILPESGLLTELTEVTTASDGTDSDGWPPFNKLEIELGDAGETPDSDSWSIDIDRPEAVVRLGGIHQTSWASDGTDTDGWPTQGGHSVILDNSWVQTETSSDSTDSDRWP